MTITTDWVRRTAVVLLTPIAASAMVLTAGAAEAHHCRAPDELGNVTANVGGVATVGVDHNNLGTTEHDVVVCADPPHQESWVDVRDLSPSRNGVQVGVGTCGLAGCTGVGYTGVEVSTPTATIDGPIDGNSMLGASLNTGAGVCPWVNGAAQACQLGGTSGTSFTGGDPSPPPPVHPAVDGFVQYWFYESLYAVPWYSRWCTDVLFQGYTLVEMTVFCTLMLTNRLVWWPLDELLP